MENHERKKCGEAYGLKKGLIGDGTITGDSYGGVWSMGLSISPLQIYIPLPYSNISIQITNATSLATIQNLLRQNCSPSSIFEC
jgi:hypothetical protein